MNENSGADVYINSSYIHNDANLLYKVPPPHEYMYELHHIVHNCRSIVLCTVWDVVLPVTLVTDIF